MGGSWPGGLFLLPLPLVRQYVEGRNRNGRGLLPQDPAAGAGGAKAAPAGLSGEEVRRRTGQYGPNKLSEGKQKSVSQIFFEQFKDLLVVILLIAAVISALSENVESTIVIFAVLVLNAILGTAQYVKAGKIPGEPEGDVRSLGQSAAGAACGWRSPLQTWCPATSCCWRPGTWWWPTAAFWRTSL